MGGEVVRWCPTHPTHTHSPPPRQAHIQPHTHTPTHWHPTPPHSPHPLTHTTPPHPKHPPHSPHAPTLSTPPTLLTHLPHPTRRPPPPPLPPTNSPHPPNPSLAHSPTWPTNLPPCALLSPRARLFVRTSSCVPLRARASHLSRDSHLSHTPLSLGTPPPRTFCACLPIF